MKNVLVNQSTGENYGKTDKYGTWEVLLENGKAKVKYIGGVNVEEIEPSEIAESLEDFENELSDRFNSDLAFSGLTERERSVQNNFFSK